MQNLIIIFFKITINKRNFFLQLNLLVSYKNYKKNNKIIVNNLKLYLIKIYAFL